MSSFRPDIPWVFLIGVALVLAHVAGWAGERLEEWWERRKR